MTLCPTNSKQTICTYVTTPRNTTAITVTDLYGYKCMQLERSTWILRNITNFHTFIYFMPPLYRFCIQFSFTVYTLTKEWQQRQHIFCLHFSFRRLRSTKLFLLLGVYYKYEKRFYTEVSQTLQKIRVIFTQCTKSWARIEG